MKLFLRSGTSSSAVAQVQELFVVCQLSVDSNRFNFGAQKCFESLSNLFLIYIQFIYAKFQLISIRKEDFINAFFCSQIAFCLCENQRGIRERDPLRKCSVPKDISKKKLCSLEGREEAAFVGTFARRKSLSVVPRAHCAIVLQTALAGRENFR